MASFYDTTVGQMVEFQRVLAAAKFTRDTIDRIIKDPELARKMYESIQLSEPMASMPSWWRTPEQQLTLARHLWPDAVLPEPPKEFTPRTKSEVLLLHVPDTFDSLWEKIGAFGGWPNQREGSVRSDELNLRLAPNKREYMQPVWLAFDPQYGRGARPNSMWGQENLAASEVFSALIQFPKWYRSWSEVGGSFPNLSGFQLRLDDDEWGRVPYLYWYGEGHGALLTDRWGFVDEVDFASPSVREC